MFPKDHRVKNHSFIHAGRDLEMTPGQPPAQSKISYEIKLELLEALSSQDGTRHSRSS